MASSACAMSCSGGFAHPAKSSDGISTRIHRCFFIIPHSPVNLIVLTRPGSLTCKRGRVSYPTLYSRRCLTSRFQAMYPRESTQRRGVLYYGKGLVNRQGSQSAAIDLHLPDSKD